MRVNNVSVMLMKTATIYVIKVSVYGILRDKQKANVVINPADKQYGGNPQKISAAVGVAAAACAEQLAEKYAEPLDPDKCYKDAVALFPEAISGALHA